MSSLLDRLMQAYHYSPETGLLTRKMQRGSFKAGTTIGSANCRGYLTFRFEDKVLTVHRVAWAFQTGSFPPEGLVIDHINRVKSDNRISNLRLLTNAKNIQNQTKAHRNNKLGLTGVRKTGNRYQAKIKVNGAYKHLGSFLTPETAHAAYLEAKRIYHPICEF